MTIFQSGFLGGGRHSTVTDANKVLNDIINVLDCKKPVLLIKALTWTLKLGFRRVIFWGLAILFKYINDVDNNVSDADLILCADDTYRLRCPISSWGNLRSSESLWKCTAKCENKVHSIWCILSLLLRYVLCRQTNNLLPHPLWSKLGEVLFSLGFLWFFL